MIKVVKRKCDDKICMSCKSKIEVYDIRITPVNNCATNIFSLCEMCLRKLKIQIKKEIGE
jgi:hypothetical protein